MSPTPPEDHVLSPDQTVRILRAKAADLEGRALHYLGGGAPADLDVLTDEVGALAADLSLVTRLVADLLDGRRS